MRGLISQVLLHNGSDVNVVDSLKRMGPRFITTRTAENMTPLLFAARHERVEVAHVLLAKGANIESRRMNSGTAVHYATTGASEGDSASCVRIASLLLRRRGPVLERQAILREHRSTGKHQR